MLGDSCAVLQMLVLKSECPSVELGVDGLDDRWPNDISDRWASKEVIPRPELGRDTSTGDIARIDGREACAVLGRCISGGVRGRC